MASRGQVLLDQFEMLLEQAWAVAGDAWHGRGRHPGVAQHHGPVEYLQVSIHGLGSVVDAAGDLAGAQAAEGQLHHRGPADMEVPDGGGMPRLLEVRGRISRVMYARNTH